MSILFCFVGVISLSLATLDTKISLNGDDWTVTNGSMKSIPATVPGEIYLPLVAAGILTKPYYDLNVMLDRWVAQTNWNYTKTFTIDSSTKLLDNDIIQIVFDGIDTNAHVYINNNYIFFNDNMFHKSVINIKKYLQYGTNTILVELFSKVNWAGQQAQSCSAANDGQCPGCTSQDQGFKCVNYIRTEPCSFAWDWGPAYAPMGIWKAVYLQAYSTAVVRDFLIWAEPVNNSIPKREPLPQGTMSDDEYLIYKAYFNEYKYSIDYTQWNTQVVVYIDAGANNVLWPANNNNVLDANPASISGTIQINIDGISQVFKKDVTITQGSEMNYTVDLGVLKNINTWMPNKFGKQTLYNFNVNFIVNSVSDVGKIKPFGFRKIELIQDPLPGGRSFYFRINGDNIPIHGSNWIPSYALDNSNYSVNTKSLENIFIGLYNSNQNMIRNWGGGIYQQTDFYDLADKYGILIWQDFMFACASYWDNKNWLKSVNKESHDFLRERQTYASIAIWAANNENGGDCHTGQESETAYRDLYWKNVLDVVKVLDPTRPKVSSSPSNGNETEQKPCAFNGNTQDAYYGDVHQYLYNKDCWNIDIYVKARFVSEFGWQSWPSYSTMSKYLSPDQHYYNSPVMQNRQHHPNGQQQMVTEIQLHYNLPVNYYNTSKPDDIGYRYMLFATQYSQAYCYKVEVEYFRSLRNTCSSNIPGCTMGEMYWQTNDIWPGASWSGIDFDNRYKLVQYFSKKFYSKILVGGHYGGNNYTFYGINDYINQYQCVNCILNFNAWSFSNGPKKSWNITVNIPYQTAVSNLFSQDYDTFTNTTGCVSLKYDCMLIMNLYDKNGTIMNTNFLLVGSSIMTTNSKDPKPTIIDVSKNNNGDYDIQFSVDALAVFVTMETNITGIFDDNGMVLTPGKYVNTFYTNQDITAGQLKDSLYLYSLYEAGGFQNSPQYL
eukprot:480967_1